MNVVCSKQDLQNFQDDILPSTNLIPSPSAIDDKELLLLWKWVRSTFWGNHFQFGSTCLMDCQHFFQIDFGCMWFWRGSGAYFWSNPSFAARATAVQYMDSKNKRSKCAVHSEGTSRIHGRASVILSGAFDARYGFANASPVVFFCSIVQSYFK